jgi:hypothetical protein
MPQNHYTEDNLLVRLCSILIFLVAEVLRFLGVNVVSDQHGLVCLFFSEPERINTSFQIRVKRFLEMLMK